MLNMSVVDMLSFNKDQLGKFVYQDWLTAFSELVAHSKLVAELEADILELRASEPTLLH